MTKKTFNQLLIFITVLTITSCLISGGSNNLNVEKNDVLGSWKITKRSLKKITSDEKRTEDKIITSFILNSDSTAIITFGESDNKKMNGTWIWQAEKKMGNNNFGISISSDVVLNVNGLSALALQLEQKGEKNNLKAGDYTFEKQE
ncbi:hypothetical protein [Carboxylicivirga caseinilyticus]|uniref:hypothetical protein n=1 Tax=Carboxylicivirga caseinilyticus TaxID=3417572 RepID=UPI003D32D972|nr:hypothetical protein [Marinilabiliaceae bacterium A049]